MEYKEYIEKMPKEQLCGVFKLIGEVMNSIYLECPDKERVKPIFVRVNKLFEEVGEGENTTYKFYTLSEEELRKEVLAVTNFALNHYKLRTRIRKLAEIGYKMRLERINKMEKLEAPLIIKANEARVLYERIQLLCDIEYIFKSARELDNLMKILEVD